MNSRTAIFAAALAACSIPALAQTTPVAPTAAAPVAAPKNAEGAMVAPAVMAPATAPMASRNRMQMEKGEKEKLEQALQAGKSRADYRSIIEKNGYKVSAINTDKPDALEYEIVKGDKSYEVQLDFKDNAATATKIDVATNMWRAEGTEKMMKDEKYVHTTPLVADPDGQFSDRRYMKEWTNEKDMLEKALSGPMKADAYAGKLKELGYKVTSFNDKEKDYVEYEVVKGKNSYEVQIDLDPATQMGKKVDVTTNVWETDATERAKGEKASAAPATNADKEMPKKADGKTVTGAPMATPMSTRNRMQMGKDEKEKLEQALMAGNSRADYLGIIEKNGYKVSAINTDKPDALEYEIVKGDKSYEVQFDFKDNAPKATKIDVATNMWRAKGTEMMMKDEKYVHTTPLVADPDGQFSDRRYMKEWTNEKDMLEKALAGPMKADAYAGKLKELGYKVTSVNDKEKDYVEYEVVKGKNSYEVQIDLDPATQMGKKVDVATNAWEADATEKAKAKN